MFHSMIARRSMVAATVVGLGIGAICSLHVRGQDAPGPAHEIMMPMSPDEQKAAMDQLEKYKQMAADPQQQEALKTGLARLMVMEEMSHMMATDPQFQPAALDFLKDPSVKKVHDQAKEMAMDPEQMKKMEAEIAEDPKALHMVLYRALQMSASDKPMDGKK
jgi:hypothetical protein